MRKRTIVLLALGTVLAALVGGIGSVLVVAMANPGVKGPHVSDAALLGAFAIGAAFGGGLVLAIVRVRVRPRRRPPWMDSDAP
jgi:hypothetical protein